MTILQSGIAQAAAGATGYQIARSLRFNIADSATLSRTFPSAGNKTTWTYSTWIKRSTPIAVDNQGIFATMPSPQQNRFHFTTSDKILFLAYNGGGFVFQLQTTQSFRDYAAWLHLVAVVDSTNATASERIRLYVNGSRITALDIASYPSQNADCLFNGATLHEIGGWSSSSYFGGYQTEIHFVDGQALDPSYFGETSTATGVWMPKQVTGMTYGTNGFYLKLDDNSNNTAATLGKDSSGNSNNWTPNNFSVTAGVGNDSLVDSPTNYGTDTGAGGEVRGNYATLNPLDNALTLANGNLQATGGSSWSGSRATFAVSSGKWYWECQLTSGTDMMVGLTKQGSNIAAPSGYVGNDANGWGYNSNNGQKYIAGASSAAYGATWTVGDIIGLAFDADTGSITCYKNNTSQGVLVSGLTSGPYFPSISLAGSSVGYINFGQRPFAYTAPSGFKALCSTNLPTPAIGASATTLASKQMNVVNWTGTGASQSVTGVGFQPDLVWIKRRDSADNHSIFDAVRGTGKYISSNLTNTEATDNSSLTAFGADGFTSGGSVIGGNGFSYVSWNWKGANATVSNTSGSITSTVSANPAAGISVVSWTSNAAAAIETMGHGLGVTPSFVIIKNRDLSDWWLVYHKSFSNTVRNYLQLNTTGGVATASADYWGHTSTLLGVRQTAMATASGQRCIAYCFAEVPGFSKFGSYTGNGSTDGPFVYCGFRPKFVLVKNTDTGTEVWGILDSTRDTYNVANKRLYPNASNAENTGDATVVDFLSNGFKLRSTDAMSNASRAYIFAAFAEAPFNYARAR